MFHRKNLIFVWIVVGLSLFQSVSARSFWEMRPQTVREYINQNIMAVPAERPEVYATYNVLLEREGRTTPLRIYLPHEKADLPIILLIHGGGWVAGDLETHDHMARYLAQHAEAMVIALDYLNAPEGKFPLPLEQCYDVLSWLNEHAADYEADVTRLAVVGDNAGGNMAAALCLLARDRKGPRIILQALINPSTDLTCSESLQRQGDKWDNLRWMITQYISAPGDVYNPYVSPLKAANLAELPPALIVVAELDLLREMGQQYADRLIDSGVATNLYIHWGVDHLAGHVARAAPSAYESLDVTVAALRGAFQSKQRE